MFDDIDIILASGSPRRRQLLTELGVTFRVVKADCEESYPEHLKREEIAEYLSQLKAHAVRETLAEHSLLITADTIVWSNGKALGKPNDEVEAFEMLKELSGKTHDVITGITLKDRSKERCVSSITEVTFENLTDEEINYYIQTYKPFDKAGAYGIQEWIGLVGVKAIHGCYYNVMGLPVPLLYHELKNWKFENNI